MHRCPAWERPVPVLALPFGGALSIQRLAVFEAMIDDQFETKLVDSESQAAVLIANENDDVMHTQIGFAQVEAENRAIRPAGGGRGSHLWDYEGRASEDFKFIGRGGGRGRRGLCYTAT